MFIDWLDKHIDRFSYALYHAMLCEPSAFNTPDGRFMKDKLHMRALDLYFPDVFKRVEDSVIDIIHIPTGETISLKSQKSVFQRESKNGLTRGNKIILVNTNSAYESPDLPEQYKRLRASHYILIYQREPFAIGVIRTNKIWPFLSVSGSQVKFRAPNTSYDIFRPYNFTDKKPDNLDIIWYESINNVFDNLLRMV